MSDTPDKPQLKSVEQYVLDVLTNSEAPLELKKIKTELLKIPDTGIKAKGKDKLTDERIQSALDTEIENGKAFKHPPKKTTGEPRYATTRPKTAEEVEDEKKRLADEKAAEKKRVADEKAVEKKRLADEKAAEKKQAAAEAAAVAIRQKVLDKVAALGDNPVPESQLGKPKANTGQAAMAVYEKVLDELLADGTLHKHGAKYGKKPPKPPKVVKWYETAPHKARFGALLKKAKELIGGGIGEEQLFAELQRQIVAEPTAAHTPPEKSQPDVRPEVQPLVAPSAERPAISLRDAIKNAYDELKLFKEYRDGLVEIPHLYHEIRKSLPELSVEAFHGGLNELDRQHVIELHGLNEVREAKHREWAIERDGRLLYFVRWR